MFLSFSALVIGQSALFAWNNFLEPFGLRKKIARHEK
jgi:hypothetical protein